MLSISSQVSLCVPLSLHYSMCNSIKHIDETGKIVRKRVAADCDLQEWQQTYKKTGGG